MSFSPPCLGGNVCSSDYASEVTNMGLVQQLFSDWVGILSVLTVGFVLVMAVFLTFYVLRHMKDESTGKPAPR
jgi:hypothetical protein